MFSSLRLFSEVPCPLGSACGLKCCGFNHEVKHSQPKGESNPAISRSLNGTHDVHSSEPPLKRRKVDTEHDQSQTPAELNHDSKRTVAAQATPEKTSKLVATSLTRPVTPPSSKKSGRAEASSNKQNVSKAISDARPSPAVKLSPKPSSKVTQVPVKKEQLVPRSLAHPPAQFATRMQLLKPIYEQLVRLNKELKSSGDLYHDKIVLSDQEVITHALNEEEKIANENPKVYSNMVKHRILALRRLKVEEWKKIRLEAIANEEFQAGDSSSPAFPKVKSGLTAREELALLPSLQTPITTLAEHGYVPLPPTQAAIDEARREVDAARHWERCDRCDSRFQMYPGRKADGTLSTNGPCIYHFGRKRRPPKQAGDGGSRGDLWTCCGAEMGSKGCTRHDSHVFKITDPKRLALVLNFESTYVKGPVSPSNAVAFDCEMGYTSVGLELIRLTAVSWPSGDELVDVLVRPVGEVIDLNSRFSGIWAEDFANAVPFDAPNSDVATDPNFAEQQTEGKATQKRLRIVDSPRRARELLQEHLTTTTPLIGHAIDNDLNAVRICHPCIVDTTLLFPHPQGLPYRYGLKNLSKIHLGIDIQTAGASGHDSREDALATGELVRFKVSQKWKDLKREGWKVNNGSFIPPLSRPSS